MVSVYIYVAYYVVFTLSLYKDVISSGKADMQTDKGYEQKTMTGEEKASLPHDGQSHSTEATKFSLTSLLTSSGSGTSHMTTPISSSSEITTASLTDTNQSLHRNSKPPLTTNTLLTHRKALSSNFNGHSIEKSLHLKCENNHDKLMKSSTDTNLSADTRSDSRTNSLHDSDTSSSDIGDGNDSTTALNLSAVKPNAEVSEAGPTSECDGAHAPDSDDSSASTSKTRTVGLMDLLTTAVEDKNSSVVLDTHEDKWMFPHAMKEVRVSSNHAELQYCLCYAGTLHKKISKETTS